MQLPFDMTPAMLGVQVLGALLVIAAIATLTIAQFSRRNKFDAAQMFQDEQNRTSSSKFVGLLGGLASIWIVVYLTVADKLTGDVFGLWLGIIVLGKLGSEYIAKKDPPEEKK